MQMCLAAVLFAATGLSLSCRGLINTSPMCCSTDVLGALDCRTRRVLPSPVWK